MFVTQDVADGQPRVDDDVRATLGRLASLQRPSASASERAAGQLLAGEFASRGARVRVEHERVHGTYWVPLGLACGGAALSALASRGVAGVVSALCALANADDLAIGRRPLRRVLRQRLTANVIAEYGPPSTDRVLVVHAHHDAARTGVVFHPALARLATRLAGRAMDRVGSTPAPLWGAVAAPATVAAGALTRRKPLRALGAVACAGHVLALVNIACSPPVPGANDNLSGVGVLLGLARRLVERPPEHLRVILLSTGSEESFLEAMQRFGQRHFPGLDRDTTTFLCVESVGSPQLMLLDGEGLLRLRRYPQRLIGHLTELAREAGITLRAPFRYRLATDGQVPLQAGYQTAVISSMDWYHAPSNYHWPSDRPQNLDWRSVAQATRLADALVRRLDRP